MSRDPSATRTRGGIFTATRVMEGEGAGLVYELDCICAVCRSDDHGFLCEHITSFIRAMPTHTKFVLGGGKWVKAGA